jgi:Ca2+-transporting ATPase
MNNENLRGLRENDVPELRERFGENVLPERGGPSALSVFWTQFKSPLIYILLFAAFTSLVFKEYTDAGLIGLVIVFNAVMGFYHEYSAQQTLTALRKILKPKATVIRDGLKRSVEVREIVPGDLVLLTSGDQVPADGELVEGSGLIVQEAILTGEEEAVGKKPGASAHGKNDSAVFMGTTVVGGRGTMKVMKTGPMTEIGKIGQGLLEIKEEKTPLQVRLDSFARSLAYLVAVVCVVIFTAGILHNEGAWDMFKLAVILSVAAIPEGLPIAVTIILSLGMKRILKRNGLVKKLLSMETLGSSSVICTDKTGTLTQGKMQVVKENLADRNKMLLALALSNNQKSGLEICLWNYIREQSPDFFGKISKVRQRIYEEPFDSEKKYSLTIDRVLGKDAAFIVGAPEIVLDFCSSTPKQKEEVIERIESWAGEGFKVIGAAFKAGGDLKAKSDYVWLGTLGIEDPIRPEVKEAIETCRRAGIKIKIVTGDYRKTAEKVASRLGIEVKPENVLEGKELEAITDEELAERIEDTLLFSRVSPHQKLKIVRALQEKGEVVAMTGDGVNDALALKKANIGVAVDNASDVAKEASDLILLDSNFKTIVAAVEEGRLILSNIKKVIGYVLSNSFAEIFLISGAILMDMPTPLTVVQILWIHLICDGPPDITLGFEPKEEDLMVIPPKKIQRESIFGKTMMFLTFSISLTIGASVLFAFRYFFKTTQNLELARTIAFASVGAASLIYVFAFKNLGKLMVRTKNFFQNKYLTWGILYGLVLIFIAVYHPKINAVLGTVPLKPAYWILVLLTGTAATVLVETVKIFRAKFTKGKTLKV